jgi:carbon-monoxide dehydrogenase large subunit
MNEVVGNGAASEVSGRWIGRAVARLEDARLLLGHGRYVDDIVLKDQLYAHFVRSPRAHARIIAVDTAAAASARGVVAVFTAADMKALGDVKPNWLIPGARVKGRPVLAGKIVRHVGEAVAMVIAQSAAAALDAAELVKVSYESLPTIFDAVAAMEDHAVRVHENLPDNIAATFQTGRGGFEEAARKADVSFRFSLTNQRLVPFSIEPRAVNASYDPSSGQLTVHCANQIPHMLRRMLAAALQFPEHKLRVISPDVGGGFGPKMHFYPEDVLLAFATRKLGQPVKWTETRTENTVATTHGRDHAMTVDVAANRDGKIVAMRANSFANVGAYLSSMGSGVPTVNVALFALGVYAIRVFEMNVTCVFTNTTPVDAYRGAGRPEAAYLIERTVDRVARELGMDPAEVRRRNFVQPHQMPYRQPAGTTLDSGRYDETLTLALERADYAGLRAMQAKARADGRLLGIGIASYTQTCGVGAAELLAMVGFDRGGFESALVRVHPDGRVLIMSGSHSHGQGHPTTFAQIAADELGIAPENIEVVQGDTDLVPFGIGTWNSRSVSVGGSAVKVASARIAERMKRIAAHLTQTTPDRIVLADGLLRVEGANASVTIAEVARAAWTGQGIPREIGIGLEETEFYHPKSSSSPHGAHVALVEVDAGSGAVSLLKYVAVDDCGVVINPLLARGQVHGGLAQGIGQALYEGAFYDDEGVPVADPPLPRFDMLPRFETDHTITPTPTNPLGAKGLGEAGAIGGPPAVVNAAIDALWHLGVHELDMPLTPERVQRALREAKQLRPS